jgi:transcriptional regulator with XRE-family HTH domain
MTEKNRFFGKRLLAARKRAGLTQQELGDMLRMDHDCSASRISRFESNKHMPHYTIVEKLAVALDVPMLYFYCADEALATMFMLLSERQGHNWNRFLLAQMRDTLVQGRVALWKEKSNMEQQTDGEWPRKERRTQGERRCYVERRYHVERRNQIDRRETRPPEEKTGKRGGAQLPKSAGRKTGVLNHERKR